jgi:hypothetical protein
MYRRTSLDYTEERNLNSVRNSFSLRKIYMHFIIISSVNKRTAVNFNGFEDNTNYAMKKSGLIVLFS